MAATPSAQATSKPLDDDSQNINQPNTEEPSITDLLAAKTAQNSAWMPIALLALGGWIITLLYLWVKHSRSKSAEEASPSPMSSDQYILKTLSKQLQAACKKNDAAAAKQQLQSWLVCYKKDYPIDGELSIALNKATAELDNHLFNNHSSEQSWDGRALQAVVQALITASSHHKKNHKPSTLGPLYPGQ